MDQIEEIRSKIDLVAYISEFLPLKKAGRNFKGLCPFHAEKTPSFIVSPERQIWHCFGGCQKGGDAFQFLMEIERIEFGEALRILAKKTGVTLSDYRPSKSEADKEKIQQINHLSSEFFHYLLLKHPIGKKGLDYILQRGISKDSLEQFKIGYSPPMWDGLQRFLVGKKGFNQSDLEKAGLIIPSTKYNPPAGGQSTQFYDRFRDRLMFPLSDHRGNVVGFAGRLLDPNAKEAKYVNTPETLIYHKSDLLYPLEITKEDIKKENSAVVVEGELDAISSYQAGVKNVVAIKGTALTEPQVRLLKRFTENLFLSLDADSAGDMAARRGIEIADKEGLNLKIVVLEKYKDPDEAAQKEPEYLKKQIQKAENVYDFYINSAFKRLRGQTVEEKKKIGQELIPILAKIEDEIVKDFFLKKLSEKLGVNEESLILQSERFIKKSPVLIKEEVLVLSKPKMEVIEEYFLALFFQGKTVEKLIEEENASLIKSSVFVKLISYLPKYFEKKKKFSSKFFIGELPEELHEVFNKLFLVDFGEKIDDEEWLKKEIEKTKNRLIMLLTKDELKETGEKMRKNPAKDEEKKLYEQFCLLTKRLGEVEKEMQL